MMTTKRLLVAVLTWVTAMLSASATDYTTYLTAARGFTEVTSVDDIIDDPSQCYLLTAAENTSLFVGVGRYEAKPGWAGDDTKALRYRQAGDPVADLSNFFTIEKEGDYIGLRNVFYHTSLFQTHNDEGYMYVLTYTEPTMSDWCYLTPTFQDGYWLFENGKYPLSSEATWKGFMGPWNNKVQADEPIALNRLNTSGDLAGHYRLFRITRANLLAQQRAISESKPADMTFKITNPSFETGNETGWTLIGKEDGNPDFAVRGDYGMSGKAGSYLMNAYQWWATTLAVSQTVTNVPSGEYELSGVVCTWAERTVTLSANESAVTKNGVNDGTGIPASVPVTIGADGKLTVRCESTAQWWNEGHEGETQTFFKLDDVQLKCNTLYLDGVSVPLPNNETKLVAGQWYYYETDYETEYVLVGNLTNMVCTTNGQVPAASAGGTAPARLMTLPVGRTYFKTTDSDATLVIAPYSNVEEGTFTAVALNVDGLPNEINYGIGKIDLNPDGPGADGTRKISQYLASKNYDIIGCSEDFNYNGSLMESLNDNYNCGTIRKTVSASGISISDLLKGKLHVETDGLNLIWKKSLVASDESWTRWNSTAETDGNQYVEKGFRHYNLWLGGSVTIDLYVLHMDAGDESDATWSRNIQWAQLCDAINGSDHTRAKLIIGDTNSRWTRDDITGQFVNRLSTDFTMSDVWAEFYRGGVYPTTDMSDLTDRTDPTDYSKYEIVDKIIYINPKAANTVRLVPQTFRIEQDYTYGTVEGTDNTTPLGDHDPVVVTFKYILSGDVSATAITLLDNADNATAISNAVGVLSDVTLSGRTLYKDDKWNTICLPFDTDLTGDLADATLKELDTTGSYGGHTTGLADKTLYLNFKDATTLRAGVPYLIKWAAGTGITDPKFTGITVSGSAPAAVTSTDGKVTLQGCYSPLAVTGKDQSLLFLSTDNKLYWPGSAMTIGAFRAYFRLNTTDPVRQFVLNFGDEATAINDIAYGSYESYNSQLSTLNSQLSEWHSLDGRRLDAAPTKKGIYIRNGRKVVK